MSCCTGDMPPKDRRLRVATVSLGCTDWVSLASPPAEIPRPPAARPPAVQQVGHLVRSVTVPVMQSGFSRSGRSDSRAHGRTQHLAAPMPAHERPGSELCCYAAAAAALDFRHRRRGAAGAAARPGDAPLVADASAAGRPLRPSPCKLACSTRLRKRKKNDAEWYHERRSRGRCAKFGLGRQVWQAIGGEQPARASDVSEC